MLSFMTLIWGSIKSHTNLTLAPGTDPFNREFVNPVPTLDF